MYFVGIFKFSCFASFMLHFKFEKIITDDEIYLVTWDLSGKGDVAHFRIFVHYDVREMNLLAK